MFFRIDLLNKFSQGRFSESWLAATCPSLFRHNYRKNNVVKISVTKICVDIQEMWNTSSNQVNDRLSLYLAAQLLYGTVCIHQQQVHFLYETTLELFCLENEMRKLLRTNTQKEKKRSLKKPRSRYVLKCKTREGEQAQPNFLMEDYGLVVCQSQENVLAQNILEKSVEELLQQADFVSVPNASITLVEEPITTSHHDMAAEIQADEQQIFNGPEYVEFMNFNEENPPTKRARPQEVPLESLLESSLDLIQRINQSASPLATTNSFDFYQHINTDSTPLRDGNQRNPFLDRFGARSHQQNSIMVENAVESVLQPLIPRTNQSATPLAVTSSFNKFYQDIYMGSTPLQDGNQADSFLDRFGNESKQQNTIMAQNTIESVAEPAEPLPFEKPKKATAPKITKRGRGGKNRILIDSIIKITDKCFYGHIQDFTSTLRVLHPTDDIMSPWQLELKRDIFHIAANKILALPLRNEYKSHLITITSQVAVDTNIFDGLLNPFEATPPRQDYGKRRGKKRTHDDQIVKSAVEKPMVPVEISLPMEIEVNPLPMIPIENLLPVEPEITLETINIPFLFHISGLTDSLAKEKLSKNEIYQHLETLWSLKVYPIGMRTMCAELKQRKYIAMVFYSLLCLQKDGMIKLISNSNSQEIYHIQPGDSISNLN